MCTNTHTYIGLHDPCLVENDSILIYDNTHNINSKNNNNNYNNNNYYYYYYYI